MQATTKTLCVTIAYLIGVDKPVIDMSFREENGTIEALSHNQNAQMVRYLNKLRKTLWRNFKKTDYELKHNLTNINKLGWFDADNIKSLEEWGTPIVHANWTADKYIFEFTRLINENICKVHDLFPDWVNWDYIKNLFFIPHYKKKGVILKEHHLYNNNYNYYPFQAYIHWKPYDCGGMLINDGKFLAVLYKMNGDTFQEKEKIADADIKTKESIYNFIDESQKVAIAVDCENSDVYKLYGVLRNLKQDELAKISKMVLYDDPHTTDGWDWLGRFTKIPVEHIEVERVTERKSLVDIKMTAGVCKDCYENGITSFIIFSSDSDYWGLISTLPNIGFLVMYEDQKCGQNIKKALAEHNIYHCSIDDFCTGNSEELKKAVLLDSLEQRLSMQIGVNSRELLEKLYIDARVEATANEKEAFYQKYFKALKLVINGEGNFEVAVSR